MQHSTLSTDRLFLQQGGFPFLKKQHKHNFKTNTHIFETSGPELIINVSYL